MEALHQQVELSFACANLVNLDTFSLTDAFIVVEVLLPEQGVFVEVTRTKTVWDNLNPIFAWVFPPIITYCRTLLCVQL